MVANGGSVSFLTSNPHAFDGGTRCKPQLNDNDGIMVGHAKLVH